MNKQDILEKAKKFIYRNARLLDLARWKYHFENGFANDVLNCLSMYQNDDGGFAYVFAVEVRTNSKRKELKDNIYYKLADYKKRTNIIILIDNRCNFE